MSFLTFLVGMQLVQDGERQKAEERRTILEAQQYQKREREYKIRLEEQQYQEEEKKLQEEWKSFCCEQEYFRDDNYQKPRELEWEVIIAKKIPPYIWGMTPLSGFKNYRIARQIAIEQINNKINEVEDKEILRQAREMGYDD